LTQEVFAARRRIPLGTPRDREQGRREPDAAALAYLRVIEREPEAVERALASPPAA
jgi:putative transcriptional regulator